MNNICAPAYEAKELETLRIYLDIFFDGEIPEQAMKLRTWEETREYLSGFAISKTPEKIGTIEHKIYGFEKENLLKLLQKAIFY